MLRQNWLTRFRLRLEEATNRWHATRRCRAALTPRPRRVLQLAELEERILLSASPAGGEFLVNSETTGLQAEPAVAVDADGDFVAVWASSGQDGSGAGIYAQRYSSGGVAQGSEFQVNSTTNADQLRPAVAMDADGNFVVVWDSAGQDGSGWGVFAQRYDAGGVAQGGEFQVNTTTADDQWLSAVALSDDGNFIVTWSSWQDGDGWGVYGRLYDASGTALTDEFRVNSTTSGNQLYSAAAMDASGDFVVTWSTAVGSDAGVRAQRYDASGVAQGGEIRVNTYTTNDQMYSSIGMDADGGFVIAWASIAQDGSGWGIYAQRFDSTGALAGSEFRVNETTVGDQEFPTVAVDSAGNFVIAWQSYNQDGDQYGIYARQYTAAGVAVGGEFSVNSTTTGSQQAAAIAFDNDGDYVVVWQGNGTGDTDGIFAQRYVTNDAPVAADDAFAVDEDATLNIAAAGVLANDRDADGNPLTAVLIDNPANGTLTLNADGSFSYSPNAHFDGTDSFTYKANDGTADSNVATVTITVNAVNDAPLLDLDADDSSGVGGADYQVNYTEKDPPVRIVDTDATLVDVDSPTLVSLTVTITNIQNGGAEHLNANTAGTSISKAYNPATGVLSLTGVDTVANYQQVLRTITYGNNEGAPVTIPRVITFVANDGAAASNVATTTLTIGAVNDPPVNTVPGPQAVDEDSVLTFSSANGNAISISDIDAGTASLQVTLTATNGTLTLAGISGLTFSTGDGAADGTMTFTGTLSNINTALNGLTFSPTANYYGAAALEIITNDLGNTGTGGAQSDTDTVSITVNPVNDAPVIDLDADDSSGVPGADFAVNYFEKSPPTLIVDSDATLSDVDSATLTSILVTITNPQNPEAESLSADTSGTSITATYNPSGVLTLSGVDTVANYQQVLRTIRYFNTSNNPHTTPRIIEFVANDGTADSNIAVSMVAVNSINDPPSNTVPPAQTTDEDVPLVFSAANGNRITVSDIDAGENSVKVTLSVTSGTLTLSGTSGLTVTTGDGTTDPLMVFTGTVADINAALNGLRFDPLPDSSGSVTLTITTDDQGNTGSGGPLSDTDTVAITVNPVNDVPTTTGIADVTVDEDASDTVIDLFAAFADIEDADDDLTYTITANTNLSLFAATTIDGTAGTLTLNYGADQYGTAEITVRATDTGGLFVETTFTVTVNPVNDAPVGADDAYVTDEDTPLNVGAAGVLANDSDIDGDALSALLVSGPFNGALTLNADGSFSYTPTLNFNGSDSFTYKANDGTVDSNVVTVTITVNAVNDIPTTSGIADVTVDEDASDSVVDLFAAFADIEDADGDLTYTITGNTNPGLFAATAVDGVAGTLTLGYAADQYGVAQITVRATDTGGLFVETTFTVTVNPINDEPTTTGIADVTVDEDAADTAVDLFAAFTDIEDADDDLTYTITGNTNPGLFSATAVDGVAGTLTLGYAADQNGVAQITVRATDTGGLFVETTFTVTVNSINDEPTTTGIADVTVDEDAADTAVDLFAAFTDIEDADGDLTYTITGNTNPGLFSATAVDGVAGTLTLGYAADQNGVAQITVRATDTGGLFVETTFTVTVNPVNDVPTTTGVADVTVDEDAADTVVDLFATFDDIEDADGDLTYTITGNTNPGLFAATAVDGVAGTLTLGYAADQNGVAQITVRATDTGGLFVETTFTVTVNAVNDTPTTTGIADITVDEDAADSVIDLFAAFADIEDADGDLTYTITGNTNPTLFAATTIDGLAGTLTLAYGADQYGTAQITVRATDTGGLFVETTFTVTVNPVNDAPVAVDDSYRVNDGEVLVTTAANGLLQNDSDIEGNSFTAVLVSGPAHGKLTLNADGSFTYTPKVNFNGADSFQYVAHDGLDGSQAATVVITVNSRKLAPPPPGGGVGSDGPPGDDVSSKDTTDETELPLETVSDTLLPLIDLDPFESGGPGGSVLLGGAGFDALNGDGNSAVAAIDLIAAEFPFLGKWNRFKLSAVPRTGDGAPKTESAADGGFSVLDSALLWGKLDSLKDDLSAELNFGTYVVGTATAMTTALSIGYVLWTIRGGYLLASMLSSMPAWRLIDPLPVLDGFIGCVTPGRRRREEEEETLQTMIENSGKPA